MRRLGPWPSLGLALLAGLVAASACKDGDGSGGIDGDPVPVDEAPQKVPATICDAWIDCDCESYGGQFDSEADCKADLEAALEADIAAAMAAGLKYDAECVGDLLALYGELGCKTLDQLLADLESATDLYSTCKIFYGDDAAGTPCTEPADIAGDSCQRGLRCNDAVCTSTEVIAAGQPCTYDQVCEGGTLCVPLEVDGDLACRALPANGETCLGAADLCNLEGYCDQASKTCRALPGAGQPCTATPNAAFQRCADGNTCEMETCVAAPAAGEPCTDVCEPGSSCEGDVCRKNAPLVCAAGFGY